MFVSGMLETAREKLVTVTDTVELVEVAKLLVSGTDLVMVCDTEGVLRGVITKTDVVRRFSVSQDATSTYPVSTVMTRDVALCRGADTLRDVAKLMKERHLKNIPVVDEDKHPIGVLTTRAVLRVLLGEVEHEEAELIDYVKGIGYR